METFLSNNMVIQMLIFQNQYAFLHLLIHRIIIKKQNKQAS